MDEVRLPDLETIRRFSIAVRQEHAPLDEVLEALRADLTRLEGATSARKPVRQRAAAPRRRTR